MAKPEFEFIPVTDVEYTTCAGDNPVDQGTDPRHDPEAGIATRILRYEPGTDPTAMAYRCTTSGKRSTSSRARSSTSSWDKTFSAGITHPPTGYAARTLAQRRGCARRSRSATDSGRDAA